MASSYSPALRLTLMADGEDPNTWGDIANTVFTLIEQATAGYLNLALSTGSVTLSTNNGSNDQARNAVIELTGVISGNCTVVIPNQNKIYLIKNSTTGAFTSTIQTAGPTTSFVAPQGTVTICFCDGNGNVYGLSNTTLAGIASTFYQRLDASTLATTPGTAPPNVNRNQNSKPYFGLAYGVTTAVNAGDGDSFTLTLTGNTTLANPTNPTDGQEIEILLRQDATGGRSVSFSSAYQFSNANSSAPIDQSPNAITKVKLKYFSAISTWMGYTEVGYTSTANSDFSFVISQNTHNFNLFNLMGGTPSSAVNIFIFIARGTVVSSLTAGVASMDLSGMPSGTVIRVLNYGRIEGKGGDGGDGAGACYALPSSVAAGDAFVVDGSVGKNGGDAFNLSGAGVTTFISNAGYIFGGGGGGGAGGIGYATTGLTQVANSGGGGGGAGNARGGRGGRLTNLNCNGFAAADGFDSISGVISSAQGAGGAGNNNGSGMSAGIGGQGGDWGADGQGGATPSSGTNNQNAKAGGTAGRAVRVNGSTCTFLSGGTAPNVKGLVS